MKKTVKKLAAIALAAAFTCGALGALTACDGTSGPSGTSGIGEPPANTYNQVSALTKDDVGSGLGFDPLDPATYPDDLDEATEKELEVYREVFADYYTAYAQAKEAESVAERYALMAVAEAKLLESNAFSFTYANGGNYAISRIAPHTVTDTAWGNDQDRFHQLLIATDYIKVTDRNALIDAWSKMKNGTNPYDGSVGHSYKGSDYSMYARQYLHDKGYTLKDEYRMPYSTEIVAWDVLSVSEQTDSEVLVNTYDGLAEYDEFGILQPALATNWLSKVNADGTQTWTFNIRQGVKWVDSQGRDLAYVTADDFVAGFQHMLDAQGGLEYLVDGVVVGASDYINGKITDFSKVGCRATSTYTVEYVLNAETSYFPTMLCYGVFAPMNRAYFTSHGGRFGVAEFAEASASESYTYASNQDNIAYCGPYLITGFTSQSNMTLEANPSYWNKGGINIKKITRLYNDGKVTTKTYDDLKAGTIDSAALNATTMVTAKGADNLFNDYAYVSGTDATAFMVSYNLNRQAYANWNDSTGNAVKSDKTDTEKERSQKALLNKNFRLALTHAFDRVKYRTVQTGDESTAANPLVNSYTPGNYVSLDSAVIIKINGTDTEFPAGTLYGEIMQAQLDADDAGITVWKYVDSKGEYSSSGFDGWYNLNLAKEQFAQAVTELAAEGVEISKTNPIKIDIVYPAFSDVYAGMQQSYKQSIETATDGFVQINLVEAKDQNELTYATYRVRMGSEMNVDVCVGWTGWGPDYGDPSTFLDTFLPMEIGYMTKLCGLF